MVVWKVIVSVSTIGPSEASVTVVSMVDYWVAVAVCGMIAVFGGSVVCNVWTAVVVLVTVVLVTVVLVKR